MDSSLRGERSDHKKHKKGKVASTKDLPFWQNRQKLVMKKKCEKRYNDNLRPKAVAPAYKRIFLFSPF